MQSICHICISGFKQSEMAVLKCCYCLIFLAVVVLSQYIPANFQVARLTNAVLRPYHQKSRLKQFINGLRLSRTDDIGQIERANQMADELFRRLNDYIREVRATSVNLRDSTSHWEYTFWGVEYTGTAELTKGKLHKMNSFNRNGDVSIEHSFPITRLTVPLNQNLTFTYRYYLSTWREDWEGDAEGYCKLPTLIVQLDLDAETGYITLHKYTIKDIGDVYVKFKGGPIEQSANARPRAIENLKPVLIAALGSFISSYLGALLNHINEIYVYHK